jgi:3'-phosphoadenosine 5'-phosphosulfate sulfotransferase (PAPS reductase)/FAD synthetase
VDKEQMAIARLQDAARLSLHRYGKPLLITYSGGKDSQVLVALAERSGIDFEVVNSHTTADAPETVYFIREQFMQMESRGINCTIEKPRYKGKPTSMWSLIPQKMMPPTRLVRYCCAVLKENTGRDRFIATGVRWAESSRRKNSRGVMELMHKDKEKRIILTSDNDEKRKLFETCNVKGKMTVNPIVDWSDDDVWDYTHSEHLPINPLYCEGQKRVGCIGCPMAGRGGRQREFMRWPAYEKMYISAFERMLNIRKVKGLQCDWQTGMDVFRWWMEDKNVAGQLSMFDEEGDQ